MNLKFLIKEKNRGSSTVEAAMIVPLVILVLAAIIKVAGSRELMVINNSKENILAALEYLKDDFSNIEDVLRGLWIAR